MGAVVLPEEASFLANEAARVLAPLLSKKLRSINVFDGFNLKTLTFKCVCGVGMMKYCTFDERAALCEQTEEQKKSFMICCDICDTPAFDGTLACPMHVYNIHPCGVDVCMNCVEDYVIHNKADSFPERHDMLGSDEAKRILREQQALHPNDVLSWFSAQSTASSPSFSIQVVDRDGNIVYD